LLTFDVLFDNDFNSDFEWSLFVQIQKDGDKKNIFDDTFIICGVPLYLEFGVKYEVNGEVALKYIHQERAHTTGTISYSFDPIIMQIAAIKNLIAQKYEILNRNSHFELVVGNINAKAAGYCDIGLGIKKGFVGFEFELGAQCEIGDGYKPNETAEFVVDYLKPINNSDFYDKYVDKCKVVLKPYLGVYGVLRIGDGNNTNQDKMNLWQKICEFFKHGWEGRLGMDFDIFDIKFFESYMWPVFETAENTRKGRDWTIKMDLPKNCCFPTILGFSLYDEDDQHITDIYCDDDDDDKNTKIFQAILTTRPGAVPIPIIKKSMEFYKGTFSNLNYDKQLKVYPLFTFLGKKILGSPVVTMNMCPDDHHPHALDLDLPDGKLWACCDVGANAPGEKGNYFAWGETTTKSSYDEESYRYYDNETFEYVNIGKEIGNTRYDVAKSKWKGDWHMPTSSDINYMFKLCKKKLFVLDGVKGILFTGTNGQSIFFPFAGDMHDNQLQGEGQYGYYWSATQAPGYDSGAYNFFITDKPSATLNYGRRHLGRTVRPVCDYKKPEDKE
jgi:hypothetical protein